MATNIEIDNDLIQEALKLGGHRTKKAVVQEALQEYVQRRKQLKVIELFGKIEYDDDYDCDTPHPVERGGLPTSTTLD